MQGCSAWAIGEFDRDFNPFKDLDWLSLS